MVQWKILGKIQIKGYPCCNLYLEKESIDKK